MHLWFMANAVGESSETDMCQSRQPIQNTKHSTHRASTLAVVLRKLNASYARGTCDLDKARPQIAALSTEVDSKCCNCLKGNGYG
jgi:hypothetical protein